MKNEKTTIIDTIVLKKKVKILITPLRFSLRMRKIQKKQYNYVFSDDLNWHKPNH